MGLAELIAASCFGTAVHFGLGPIGVPWLRSGKVTANLSYYVGPTTMDGRVNQSDLATIHVGRPSRIVWTIRERRPASVLVKAERLGASDVLVRRVRASRLRSTVPGRTRGTGTSPGCRRRPDAPRSRPSSS